MEEEVQREGGWDDCSALGLRRVSEAFFSLLLSFAAALLPPVCYSTNDSVASGRGERKRSGVIA